MSRRDDVQRNFGVRPDRSVSRSTATLLAAALALLLLIGTGFALAADEDGVESASPAGSSPSPAGEEIPALRTATSETFELPNGAREAVIYQSPIHYKVDGTWRPIESGLEEAPGPGITNGANSFDLHLPERMGEGAVRVEIGKEAWISYELRGEPTSNVKLEGGVASYPLQGSRVAFEFDGLANGIKEEIELGDFSAPHRFDFDLKLSNGLVPTLVDDGSIAVRDGDGRTLAVLPAPTIEDSAPGARPLPAPVSFELTEAGEDGWLLAVVASSEWLADPGRVWPVRIDPTTTVKPAMALDCMIRGGKNLTNTGGCGEKGFKELQTGFWPTATSGGLKPKGDERARSLLRFNLSAIPSKAGIESATLTLNAPGTAVGTSGVEIRRILKDNPWTYKATWLNRDVEKQGFVEVPIPWKDTTVQPFSPVVEGGAFNPEAFAKVLTAERGASAGPWIFSGDGMASLVQGWVTGTDQNNGLIVKLIDDVPTGCSGTCPARYVMFDSSAATNIANRPALSVTYNVPAPSTSKVVSPGEGTRTARRLKLKAAWSVAGVTGISWQYREGKAGVFHTIPAGLVRDAEGKSVSWPIPLSGVQESKPLYFDAAHASPALRSKGGVVQLRAVFEGTIGVGGFSAPVEAKVDRFIGGPRDATAEVGPGTVDLLTGNLTVTRTDVSIPTFSSSLDFSRTFNSRDAGKLGDKGVLGQGWKPTAPVEEAGAGEWRSVRLVEESETIEGESYPFTYAILTSTEGYEITFDRLENGTFETPAELTGVVLSKSENQFSLATPDGTRTTFESNGGSEYLPTEVRLTGGSGNKVKMAYEVFEGNRRLTKLIAPSPKSTTPCSILTAAGESGCRVLTFTYAAATKWGAEASLGERLEKITYHAPGFPRPYPEGGQEGPWVVAEYAYDTSGRLVAAWDPRISPNLKETYTYESGGQLKTITSPGLKPWTMNYGAIDEEQANGRLMSVERASLVGSNPVAKTTIAYEVPVSGVGNAFPMGGAEVAKWGQSDVPVDATAIFPPDQVPTTTPPSSYTRATVYYMDSDGYAVNTMTPAGAGTGAPSISTTETDEFGNVVRELTPQNRVRALAKEGESVARSHDLEIKRQYSADGTEMREEWGPLHEVRLENGTITNGRLHRVVQYDEGAPTPPGTPMPHLPTRETTGAEIGKGVDADVRIIETRYDWTLRKPTETIIDPGEGHLNLRSKTVYDSETGQPTETRQPSNPEGGGAGTTKIAYYRGGYSIPSVDPACEGVAKYAGLPCKILPAAQPGTAGQPKILVKQIVAYTPLSQPTEITERPGGEGAARKTVLTYDEAGRPLTSRIIGGGSEVPLTKTEYSSTTGLPTTQRFDCSSGGCEGSDDQAVTTSYDALGRAWKYQDADGNTSETTYDLLGRPVTTNDGKGTQTRIYDPTSGLLTKLEDSAAGSFTASYDADGRLVAEGLPNGLVAEQTYDEAGQLNGLAYDKAGSKWLDFDAERSVNGQILWQKSLTSHQEYSYDKAGRLTKTNDWDAATGGNCTTREYVFGTLEGESEAAKLAGKNSNRTKMFTRSPGIGGACASTGGSEQKYTYDGADRLTGEGIAYDDFGRITNLPGVYAGNNKTLTTTYFSTDMVAIQTQNGATNTFQLDAALRQRQRTQGGGLEGVEVFHYAGASDTPAWTQLGTKWSRNIGGIGGGVGAIQDSSSGTLLQLSNLHGDVVATATLSSSATKPVATFEQDEFGVPKLGGTPQFGWLGSKGRRTEFASGVIQMGKRSYVPALGRFLSPDPILGGSANAYEYAAGDPVNNVDLTGEKCASKNRAAVEKCLQRKQEAARARRLSGRGKKTIVLMLNRGSGASASFDPWGELKSAANQVMDTIGGGAKRVYRKAGAITITLSGPAYTAAKKAYALASVWDPEQVVQYWSCGKWLAGGAGDCDPFEMFYPGEATDVAR